MRYSFCFICTTKEDSPTKNELNHTIFQVLTVNCFNLNNKIINKDFWMGVSGLIRIRLLRDGSMFCNISVYTIISGFDPIFLI